MPSIVNLTSQTALPVVSPDQTPKRSSNAKDRWPIRFPDGNDVILKIPLDGGRIKPRLFQDKKNLAKPPSGGVIRADVEAPELQESCLRLEKHLGTMLARHAQKLNPKLQKMSPESILDLFVWKQDSPFRSFFYEDKKPKYDYKVPETKTSYTWEEIQRGEANGTLKPKEGEFWPGSVSGLVNLRNGKMMEKDCCVLSPEKEPIHRLEQLGDTRAEYLLLHVANVTRKGPQWGIEILCKGVQLSHGTGVSGASLMDMEAENEATVPPLPPQRASLANPNAGLAASMAAQMSAASSAQSTPAGGSSTDKTQAAQEAKRKADSVSDKGHGGSASKRVKVGA